MFASSILDAARNSFDFSAVDDLIDDNREAVYEIQWGGVGCLTSSDVTKEPLIKSEVP